MEMFYLVLSLTTTVIMPDKYTKDQCEAAKASLSMAYGKICVPAPIENCHFIIEPVPGMVQGSGYTRTIKVCP